jgi:hypothetical protein
MEPPTSTKGLPGTGALCGAENGRDCRNWFTAVDTAAIFDEDNSFGTAGTPATGVSTGDFAIGGDMGKAGSRVVASEIGRVTSCPVESAARESFQQPHKLASLQPVVFPASLLRHE